ncbi:UNVERIFIED_CONTAM: Inactive glucose-6-phosphate 1-dehydrogenase 4, chloroplastic [Sesamum latifolium]|uniref:Inactive glucose-6-phosphate 1-dehydrogenase 4, chloroplastic n=1 Tax=Sesamum latifolium TaxID=2727402 RepID=A0AAW2XPD3_9LAMI
MASLSLSFQQPSVLPEMAVSAAPRLPVAQSFITLAVHHRPWSCGSTWWICRNFKGLKFRMLQNLNFQGPKRKHDEKNEFKMLQIKEKDQLLDHSEAHHGRQDLQQMSAVTASNESSSSSKTQHEENSLPNRFDKSRRIETPLLQAQGLGISSQNVGIFGYSRKNLTDEDFRSVIASTLTCRIDQQENCNEKMEAFMRRTYYLNGGYDIGEGMLKLRARMEQVEGEFGANRIFYLSVPQEALLDVALSLADNAQSQKGWNRIITEKPFGSDLQSSQQLTRSLLVKFKENQLYRIDHLLGRNTIENLAVLRFSNLVFMPLWNRNYIRSVQVILSEDVGLKTPDGYLNSYGVIGDVVHSHIFQTIALLAMEPPVTLDGEDVRNEKVKLLRSIRKLETSDVILGYCTPASGSKGAAKFDKTMPTYFATALYIDNARVEIRIQFRNVPGNLYLGHIGHNSDLTNNELILHDVPDEAILVRVNNKIPGLGIHLDASELNLFYKDKYSVEVPDSYEQLLHDVIDGDNHLFMRSDEVAAAWNILAPVLNAIDNNNLVPEQYEEGGIGPDKAVYLWAKHGVQWTDN